MLNRHAERQCENSGWDMFLNELNVIHLIVLAHIFRLKIHLSQYTLLHCKIAIRKNIDYQKFCE